MAFGSAAKYRAVPRLDRPDDLAGPEDLKMDRAFRRAYRTITIAARKQRELTHDYDAVLPLMVATVVAELVARALLDHDLMTEKLVRRGLEVPRSYEPDVLGSTRVRNAMTAPVQVVSASATIAEARPHAASGGHGAYPLVDPTGRCVGIVTRTDLLVDGAARRGDRTDRRRAGEPSAGARRGRSSARDLYPYRRPAGERGPTRDRTPSTGVAPIVASIDLEATPPTRRWRG